MRIIEEFGECEDLNQTDARGFTVLHHAALLRDEQVLEALLEIGADTTIRPGGKDLTSIPRVCTN